MAGQGASQQAGQGIGEASVSAPPPHGPHDGNGGPRGQANTGNAGATVRANASANAAAGSAANATERLATLLQLEGTLRTLPDRRAVELFAVNELRQLIPFSQAVFISFDKLGKARITAFSGLARVDRQAPLVRALERFASELLRRGGKEGGPDMLHGDLPALAAAADGLPDALKEWAFQHVLWHILRDAEGQPFAALMFMRAEPWREADAVIAERLAAAVAHAIRALQPRSALARLRPPRWAMWAVPLLLLALLLFPVHMTAIAPVEVVADNPTPVTAPMDGVIADILVDPNTPVKQGQVLFRFDDTRLKAEAEVAAKREQVALARLATLRKAAFADPRARQQLAEAQTELQLARAERQRAERLLARVNVKAMSAGIAIYADRQRWLGRPVQTGEKVMEIADPSRVAFRIDLPVGDAIAITEGGRVRVFLDADPLNAIQGKVRWASFHAEEIPGGLLAFRLVAQPLDDKGNPLPPEQARKLLRIGFRGSAQVFGERVPLGFYLLRRPITAARQFFGW